MSSLNIHRMSVQVGHKIYHFRCSVVVKALPDAPHVKESSNCKMGMRGMVKCRPTVAY